MALGFLDRSRIVAPPGWTRWLVPPAALSVHLSIGQAYAWSVFKTPLEKTMHLNGTQSSLPFQLGIVMLGLSAAFGGTLVEKNGPRWAMFVVDVLLRQRLPRLRARRRDRPVLAGRPRLRRGSAASGSASATSRRSPR